MAANLLAFIQFDDNTPDDRTPFTNEPNLWSLEWDYGLWGCKDYAFIGAISGVRSKDGKPPLIPLRGCPVSFRPPRRELQDEPFVGFLTHSEVVRCLQYHSIPSEALHPSVQNLMAVLVLLSKSYGDERVRLVFSIVE